MGRDGSTSTSTTLFYSSSKRTDEQVSRAGDVGGQQHNIDVGLDEDIAPIPLELSDMFLSTCAQL